MKNQFFFLSSLLILFSCSGTHKSQKTNTDSNQPAPIEIKPVIVEPAHAISEERNYTINSFAVEGDLLKLEVSYTGGCGQHNFNLYSNGLLMKSLPPQLNVNLEHLQENESCKKEIKQTLQFDLTPIKKPGNAKIILNINSADNKAEWIIQ